jgi:RNA-binding protein 5/10
MTANFPMGRRDYSRSPPQRYDLPYDDEPPEEESRYRRRGRDYDRDNRHRHPRRSPSSPREAINALSRPQLTGETDAADVPSQLLVIYPLSAAVTEEVLAEGMKKLEVEERTVDKPKDGPNGPPKLKSTAPTGDTSGYGAKLGSLRRVFLMRDKITDESIRYGFAEFWTLEDAAAAVTKFRMSRAFTIAASPVTVSNIHLGVFVPEYKDVTPDVEHFSFHPLFNPELRVKYWDPHVYPRERTITEEPPAPLKGTTEATDGSSDLKKSKKRKADGSLATAPNKKAEKSVPMAGQMAMWQKKHAELHGGESGRKPNNGDIVENNGKELNYTNERAPVRISLSGGAMPENKAPIKIALKTPARAGPESATEDSVHSPHSSSALQVRAVTGDESTRQPSPSQPTRSYVDKERTCCLLCMMKYKSLDDLNTHERSKNHKTAMEDEEKVKAALPRLAARDKRMQKQSEEDQNDSELASQYRDRAKERRQAYNQPNKPSQSSSKQTRSDTKTPSSDANKTSVAAPAQSKGSAMLAKMGWNTGKGLGANGEGRTDIVETHAYQEGVGLGAEGGNLGDAAKLAERNTTNSYAEYVNVAQEKARERYNRLD